MRAQARLVAEYRDGRTVLRELRSMSPLTLLPKRTGGDAVVHLVSSATAPLSGDELLVEVASGGVLEYLPEPTVVTARARHTAELFATLDDDAKLRTREVLVLGRVGERAGQLHSTQRIVRGGTPVLHQELDVGVLDAGLAHLAGRRVLATELSVGQEPVEAAGGDWWSVTPLAAGGALITALAPDAVTAHRELDRARTLLGKTPW
jgi:urease accessory protein